VNNTKNMNLTVSGFNPKPTKERVVDDPLDMSEFLHQKQRVKAMVSSLTNKTGKTSSIDQQSVFQCRDMARMHAEETNKVIMIQDALDLKQGKVDTQYTSQVDL
jgi:hypothetical protein